MTRLFNILLIIIVVQLCIAQPRLCLNKDSSLCYIADKFPILSLDLVKKLECEELTRETQTPLLADTDGDCMPELIVLDTICESILIINPITGVLKNKIKTYFLNPYWNSYCLADIDFDGEPEFFVIASSFVSNPTNIRSRIICYNKNGVIRWISDQRVDRDYNNKITDLIGIPAIADFNQDGIPEIYVSNKIFNAQTGVKLADGGANGIGADILSGLFISPSTIAAQLDTNTLDLELAAGYTVYKVKILNANGLAGNIMTPINIRVNNEYKDGTTSLGDINSDGQQDIIVTTPGVSGQALIYTYTISAGMAKLVSKVSPQGVNPWIGIPLIGDIKGNGNPSIIINRENKLHSYSYDGTGFLKQDWDITTTDSSGSCGLTMFDFNNDGVQEIVIRDMTSLRIIDGSGSIPNVIAQVDCFAHTWNENPIVGSIDSTLQAMICVPCLSSLNETNGKLTIFGPPDSLPGWAPARGIWNQYNYHVLNINDDLTVPRVQKNNATYKNGKYNNFFVQESLLDSNGMYLKRAASLTGKIKSVNYNSINDIYTVTFDIYNRVDASARADSNLPVSFYNGDPATIGILIGVYHTLKKIEPGDSLLNLQYTFVASSLSDLFMVLNTTRNKTGAFDPIDFTISECDYTDNAFRTVVLPKKEKRDPCNSSSRDSNLCYIKEKYPTAEFAIEKKFESVDRVFPNDNTLLADMDGDCIPEFIIAGGHGILIIDSKTGATKWTVNTSYAAFSPSTMSVADLDNDSRPEIFLKIGTFNRHGDTVGRLICYNSDGHIRWISDQKYNLDPKKNIGGKLALADFNQDGIPEIYISNLIFNARTGVKLADGGANGAGTGDYRVEPSTIAAQLDEDSTDLELAAGYTVYKVIITNPNGIAGNSMIAHNIKVNSVYRDGFTSVADIDLDGRLDIVVTSQGVTNSTLVYTYSFSNGFTKMIAQAYPSGLEFDIGSPLVGEINNSGKPSILFMTASRLNAYSYNGTVNLQKDWSFITTDSSGDEGLTLFDFNNDGIKEIVYRDMTTLSIVDGSVIPPIAKAKIQCFSGTYYEYPIVGDIDNSGHAKICVPCDSIFYSGLGKLTVFGAPDSLPGWAPARGIWNQYNYHVLNINDDFTVPRVQKNNATYKNGKYNNFFVQESLLDSNGMNLKRAASLTGKIKCINYDPIKKEYTVIFDIHNRIDASFIADSSLPVSFYNGDPSTGGILIGTYYTLKKLFSGDSLLNLEFKFTVSNLVDLFMVINTTRNGSGQFDPKDFSILECDYTDNTFRTLELPKIEKLNASICNGDTYNFYDTLLNNAGMYYHKLSAVKGCDSLIFILELTLVDTVHTTQSIKVCDSYIWNGLTYTQSGTFKHDSLNRFGCDSITTLELIINKSNNINIQHTACDSFTWNGNAYDKSGSYPYQTINNLGCDSIITLELIINKSDSQAINHNACNSYEWNGQIYTQSGTYKFDTVNRSGCDSAVTLDLTINSIINVNLVDAACDSYTWNGNTYTQSGTYQYKTINQQGCDSITTLQLKINKSNNSTTSLTTCDNYTWNGVTYNQSGIYQQKTLNNSGCDSTATLQLTINKSSNSVIDNTSCESYTWNGNTYTQSGNYQYQTLNASGCDSIAALNLIINKSDLLNINQTACDNYTWNGITYDNSGSYSYQTVNNLGCDSVINLNLTINKSSKADLALSVCDSLNFLGKTLKANGNYTFKVQNVAGCDSVINLSLNIRSEFYNNSISSCDSFTWNLNGQSYNQSGIYLKKYFNSFGCDSIYTLDLNIFKSYELVEQAEVCKEYLWQVNKTLLKQSGEYTHTLKTIQGCDSIIKLNLIVNHDFKKVDTVVTDSAYTWFVNHQTYPVSGIYQEHFTSSGGCDSIHVLFLTIKKDVGIYFPNVIRPGGPNGWFTIFDNGYTISSITTLSIYDRWGDLIWQKHGILPNDLHMGWDGKFNGQNVMPGVYVWHAQITLQDGSVITKKGDVTAVR